MSEAAGADSAPTSHHDLQQFLLYLGSAMTAAGAPVNEVQEDLAAVARANGAVHARFAVLPTFIAVSLDPSSPVTLEPTTQLGGTLRLDQVSEVFAVLKDARSGEIDPTEGVDRLLEIVESKPRFGPVVTTVGHAGMSAGLSLVLWSPWTVVLLAAGLGLVVAALKVAAARWQSTLMLLPVAAALIVSGTTFILSERTGIEVDIRALVAPLVTFLPGTALTMGVIEIAAAQLVSGATRLVAGSLQLLLLASGIVAAGELTGFPNAQQFLDTKPQSFLSTWAPWVGLGLFTIGLFFHTCAPRKSFPGVFLVVVVAFVGQMFGTLWLGGAMSGFLGALLMTPTARLVERSPVGPPALVTFLPGFWILVPGSIGLIGATDALASEQLAVAEITGTLGAMVAIAMGVLVAAPLTNQLRMPRFLRPGHSAKHGDSSQGDSRQDDSNGS